MPVRLSLLAWLIFLGAALLEVGGDAVIRHGLRGGRGLPIAMGCAMLAVYGLLVSVVFGRVLFQEWVPASTWLGVATICLGGAIVQFGSR